MESYGHTDKGMHVGVASISRDETWVRLLNDVAKLAALLSSATRPTTMSYRRRRRRRYHITMIMNTIVAINTYIHIYFARNRECMRETFVCVCVFSHA